MIKEKNELLRSVLMSFEDVRDVSTRGLEGSFYRVRSRLKVTWYE